MTCCHPSSSILLFSGLSHLPLTCAESSYLAPPALFPSFVWFLFFLPSALPMVTFSGFFSLSFPFFSGFTLVVPLAFVLLAFFCRAPRRAPLPVYFATTSLMSCSRAV